MAERVAKGKAARRRAKRVARPGREARRVERAVKVVTRKARKLARLVKAVTRTARKTAEQIGSLNLCLFFHHAVSKTTGSSGRRRGMRGIWFANKGSAQKLRSGQNWQAREQRDDIRVAEKHVSGQKAEGLAKRVSA
jgi:hypothetical protein